MEPITLFARTADPAAVARRLRELDPTVEVDGPDDDWRAATVRFGSGASARALTFTHDPTYYAGPGWSGQMDGMRGYFERFPESDRKPLVLALTTSLRFALGTLFDPDFDADGDPRLDVLFAIAALLDGVLFTPSSLRDAEGRILLSAAGEDEEDLAATFPRVLGEVAAATPLGAALDRASRPAAEPDDPDADPPTAARVARRALALAAVTARAILEQDVDGPDTPATHRDLLAWVDAIAIDDEFEAGERDVLRCPLGELAPAEQVEATWRLEGLVVLAWALGRFAIPPHDELVGLSPLWRSLGLLDAEAARALRDSPTLRPRAEVEALRRRLFAVHWRLRNHSLKPGPMDFAEFARTCWFGPLDIAGLPLVDGDLAVGGARIDRAPGDRVAATHSAAQERHQAANWLCAGPATYSEASVAT